jgi:hypothetical protein
VTRSLGREIRVFNADATENKKGLIKEYIRLPITIGDHTNYQSFLVTDIGRQDIILGMSFLREHNPEINWSANKLEFTRCPATCANLQTMLIQDEDQDEVKIPRLEEVAEENYGQLSDDDWTNKNQFLHFVEHSDDPSAVYICSMLLEKEESLAARGEQDRDYWSSHVPPHYQDFGDVFSKKALERMPTRKPYDHEIELIPGASLPKPSKLYPLNLQERSSLDKWIDEEAAKGYIRVSKLPTAAPVFFVKKKGWIITTCA